MESRAEGSGVLDESFGVGATKGCTASAGSVWVVSGIGAVAESEPELISIGAEPTVAGEFVGCPGMGFDSNPLCELNPESWTRNCES